LFSVVSIWIFYAHIYASCRRQWGMVFANDRRRMLLWRSRVGFQAPVICERPTIPILFQMNGGRRTRIPENYSSATQRSKPGAWSRVLVYHCCHRGHSLELHTVTPWTPEQQPCWPSKYLTLMSRSALPKRSGVRWVCAPSVPPLSLYTSPDSENRQ